MLAAPALFVYREPEVQEPEGVPLPLLHDWPLFRASTLAVQVEASTALDAVVRSLQLLNGPLPSS